MECSSHSFCDYCIQLHQKLFQISTHPTEQVRSVHKCNSKVECCAKCDSVPAATEAQIIIAFHHHLNSSFSKFFGGILLNALVDSVYPTPNDNVAHDAKIDSKTIKR